MWERELFRSDINLVSAPVSGGRLRGHASFVAKIQLIAVVIIGIAGIMGLLIIAAIEDRKDKQMIDSCHNPSRAK
jgi:hypothetical protein